MEAKISESPGGAASHCTLPPGLVIWTVTGSFEQTGDGEISGPEPTRGVGNTLSTSCREVALQPFAAVTVTLYRLPLSASPINLPGNNNVGKLLFSMGVGSGGAEPFVHL